MEVDLSSFSLSRLFYELKLIGLHFSRASGCPPATALCVTPSSYSTISLGCFLLNLELVADCEQEQEDEE